MIIRFNPLVIRTFAQLEGAKIFLETMNQGIPMVQEKANRDLRDNAETQGWDGDEYHAEASMLEHGYGVWAPTFAAYSITILLYSTFETQLYSFAEYMGKKAKSNLQARTWLAKASNKRRPT